MNSDDANGDVLRRMEASGDDLSARGRSSTLVFASEEAAKQFACRFNSLGYRATAEFAETVQNLPWDVVVVKLWFLNPGRLETSSKNCSALRTRSEGATTDGGASPSGRFPLRRGKPRAPGAFTR